MKICILTKKEKPGVKEAISFTKSFIDDCDVFFGKINDPFPEYIQKNHFDILISYISPWIVPVEILEKTKIYAKADKEVAEALEKGQTVKQAYRIRKDMMERIFS